MGLASMTDMPVTPPVEKLFGIRKKYTPSATKSVSKLTRPKFFKFSFLNKFFAFSTCGASLSDEYRLPNETPAGETQFVLSCEISSVYKQDGRTRKVHNVFCRPRTRLPIALPRGLKKWQYPQRRKAHPRAQQPRSARDRSESASGHSLHPRAYLDAAFFAFRRVFGF